MSYFQFTEVSGTAISGRATKFIFPLRDGIGVHIKELKPGCGSCTKAYNNGTHVEIHYTDTIDRNVSSQSFNKAVRVEFSDGTSEILRFNGTITR